RRQRRGGRGPGGSGAIAILAGAALALDAGGAALELAQVVEAGPPDAALLHDLDLLDAARVQGEDALDPDAVGDLADGEGGAGAAAAAIDHHPLEHLDAL